MVNPEGDLARGRGVQTSRRLEAGRYEVRFRQDVSRRVYAAMFGHASGFIFVSLRTPGMPARVVAVTTTDRAGVVRDSPFHLVVDC